MTTDEADEMVPVLTVWNPGPERTFTCPCGAAKLMPAASEWTHECPRMAAEDGSNAK
jgi:hypothetical protein